MPVKNGKQAYNFILIPISSIYNISGRSVSVHKYMCFARVSVNNDTDEITYETTSNSHVFKLRLKK